MLAVYFLRATAAIPPLFTVILSERSESEDPGESGTTNAATGIRPTSPEGLRRKQKELNKR
jgi:hypothetical protein